ncbi:expressed unknown protein [Seminavis robusta]|uniref:Uncharacterized protein n=1 Tax=Seminavis robusta TaxID=568900 RepID=A0A9N8F2S2_9STRA|nr:expressed unknown protein [Seminavis robusta]|eukprot:Sro4083_g352780.1 n/a (118) ;mRNA; r:1429-2178
MHDVCPITTDGEQLSLCFDSLLPATSDVTVQTFVQGDLGSSNEFYDVIDQDGNNLGQNNGGGECSNSYDQTDFVMTQATFNTWVATGFVSFIMDASIEVNPICLQQDVYINLVYSTR